MAKRAGYTISSYLVDVSPWMADQMLDEATGRTVPGLDLVKEYVSRKIAPKIQGGRKTDHAALVTFGGDTDNPYFASDAEGERDPNDYIGVASVFPPQQAKPAMLAALQDMATGDKTGNPIAALFVADELIRQHKIPNKSGSWRREVVILTSANAKLKQGGWEDVMQMIQEQSMVLRVIGVGYDDRETSDIPEDELKKLPKSERFWRTFCQKLSENIPEGNEHLAPALGSISQALSVARSPAVDIPNSTLTASKLRIGDKEVDPQQAIEIAVRWSKGTSIARPMTLKKVLASQVAKVLPPSVTASQAGPSQSLGYGGGGGTIQGGDIQPYTKYVMTKRKSGAEASAEGIDADDGDIEEEEVDKDNLVKAYKFGSTWVPLNDEDFEPMLSVAGMDVLGFMPRKHYRRYQSMGEIYYIWPDPDSVKDQLHLSALVQALEIKDQFALLRWAQKESSAPRLGAAWPKIDEDGICYLAWVQLPFAEDERTFLFPSLTKLTSKSGRAITEHKLLPTDDQLLLMDDFVGQMDLDSLAEENDGIPWYQPQESYNPAICRLKDAVYHQAITADLDADPMPPPHPLLTQYLESPETLVRRSADTVDKLKSALEIKLIPPPIKRADAKAARVAGSTDQIDIEALFAAKPEPSAKRLKTEDGPSDSQKSKPTNGRVISNEAPLEDLKRELSLEGGDNVAKVLRDLGAVVKENVAASFSSAAFPLAIECLQEMRKQATMLEEVDLYNAYIQNLEKIVNAPKFKHRDFWHHVEKAKPSLGVISEAEAQAALL